MRLGGHEAKKVVGNGNNDYLGEVVQTILVIYLLGLGNNVAGIGMCEVEQLGSLGMLEMNYQKWDRETK
jgi:hypothetical protein